jgi:heme/copper-type cytochrome/quinol oxidase subunit 2
VASVLAHIAPELTPSDVGEIAMTVIFILAMVIPFIVLGIVCWIFWKAKKREDDEKELEWRNAPSS